MSDPHEPEFHAAHPIFEVSPEELLLIWGLQTRRRQEARARELRDERPPSVQPTLFDPRDPESQNPQQWLQAGRVFLDRDQASEAVVALEQARRLSPRDSLIQSYLGLALVFSRVRGPEGLALCVEASRKEGAVPETLLNLGRAHLASGRKRKAFEALQRGLALRRNHPDILFELRCLGIRKAPVFRFLRRGNPLNIWAGRTLHRIGLR